MSDLDPAVQIRAIEEAPIGIVVTDPGREDNRLCTRTTRFWS